MEQVWFSRSRSAKKVIPITYTYSGSLGFDITGSNVILTARSFASLPGPPAKTFDIRRQINFSNNYLSSTEINISGVNPDYEVSFPLVNKSISGTSLSWYASQGNPFYYNGRVQNIGFAYTQDFFNSVSMGYTTKLPSVLSIYNGNATPTSYTGSVMVGLGTNGTSSNMQNSKSSYFRSLAQTSQLQPLPSGGGTADYAEDIQHILKADNVTKNLSWVRSAYNTGITITQPTGTLGAMGGFVLPLDAKITLPAPENYTTPAPASGLFPGVQAEIREIVFFEPGCVTGLGSIVRTNNGTGATKNGTNNFTGYLYCKPPAGATGGRNTLPIVVEVTVTAGAISSVNKIICYGAGFSLGPTAYPMTWDQNDAVYRTVSGLGVSAVAQTYTATTTPVLTITISTSYACPRFITMKDKGDGYYWNSGAGSWTGVSAKESPFNDLTRRYTNNIGTVSWSSTSTSTSGTLNTLMPCVGNLNFICQDISPSSTGQTIGTANPAPVNPTSTLMTVGGTFTGVTTIGDVKFPYWGTSYFPAACPSSYFHDLGHLVLCNDDLLKPQWVKWPGLKYQPNVPYYYNASTSICSAERLFYTTVPASDPFIYVLGAVSTGVDNNMYVSALLLYGEYDPVTPANSVYRHKLVIYHFKPGANLDDVNTGSVWTYLTEGPEFTRTYPLWASTAYNSATFVQAPTVQWAYDANWRLNTPPLEAMVTLSIPTTVINTFTTSKLYLNFTYETTSIVIPAPSGLAWAPGGDPPNMTYDVINSRYVSVSGNLASWPTSGQTGPGLVLLSAGESLFSSTPTMTFIPKTSLGNVWA